VPMRKRVDQPVQGSRPPRSTAGTVPAGRLRVLALVDHRTGPSKQAPVLWEAGPRPLGGCLTYVYGASLAIGGIFTYQDSGRLACDTPRLPPHLSHRIVCQELAPGRGGRIFPSANGGRGTRRRNSRKPGRREHFFPSRDAERRQPAAGHIIRASRSADALQIHVCACAARRAHGAPACAPAVPLMHPPAPSMHAGSGGIWRRPCNCPSAGSPSSSTSRAHALWCAPACLGQFPTPLLRPPSLYPAPTAPGR